MGKTNEVAQRLKQGAEFTKQVSITYQPHEKYFTVSISASYICNPGIKGEIFSNLLLKIKPEIDIIIKRSFDTPEILDGGYVNVIGYKDSKVSIQLHMIVQDFETELLKIEILNRLREIEEVFYSNNWKVG